VKAPYNDIINKVVARNSIQIGELLGYVNLKAMWLVYVRPDMSSGELDEMYRRELSSRLGRFISGVLLPDETSYSAEENERRSDWLRKASPFYAAGLVGDNDPLMDAVRNFDVQSTIHAYAASFVKETTPGVFRALADKRLYPSFTDLIQQIESFGKAAKGGSEDPKEIQAIVAMTNVIQQMREQLIPLSQSEIETLRTLTSELMLFLQVEPEAMKRMHWSAFQELVWEKFACDGYHVTDVSRIKNSGGDLVAVQQEDGKQVRHLIECKRYKDKIGMAIFNQVIGAADNAETQHVFLVTSSDFTASVRAAAQERELLSAQSDRQAQFKNIMVDLVNGKRLVEWLREYKVRVDGGLYLREDWNLDADETEAQQ
jgi:restriction endonuclease Mrr